MLFQQCTVREEKDLLEGVFNHFLKHALNINLKANKAKTVFAHYCGFDSYNHAKAIFDKMPQSDDGSFRSFPDLVFLSNCETGHNKAVSKHLLDFLDTELSISFKDDDKKDGVLVQFFMTYSSKDLKHLNPQISKHTQRDYILSTGVAIPPPDSYKSIREMFESRGEHELVAKHYKLHDYQMRGLNKALEAVGKPVLKSVLINPSQPSPNSPITLNIESLTANDTEEVKKVVDMFDKVKGVGKTLAKESIFPDVHKPVQLRKFHQHLGELPDVDQEGGLILDAPEGMTKFRRENESTPYSLSDDGSILVMGEGHYPNLVELASKHKRVLTISSMMNIGIPVNQLGVNNMTMMGDSKVVVVAPKSLLFNYKKTLAEYFGITDCEVVLSSKDFGGLNHRVTIISEHLFSKTEFSKEDASNAIVFHEHHPMRMSANTNTMKAILSNLDNFKFSWIHIEGMAQVSDRMTKELPPIVDPVNGVETLLERLRRYINLNYFGNKG
ncbi:hypothetical protein [Vibrio crassostreae]|uniref:hypothetical protein n=1 Tax=Vibrio crassostreae TaxID=246167 RepID=UPI001B309152|nr:hypothetical protein [Vibrio crassostreae]